MNPFDTGDDDGWCFTDEDPTPRLLPDPSFPKKVPTPLPPGKREVIPENEDANYCVRCGTPTKSTIIERRTIRFCPNCE